MLKVAYVLQAFPGLTMTFIYREVMALQKRGLDVTTISVWRPSVNELSQESVHLMQKTYYVFPVSPLRFLLVHMRFLARHPRKYVGTGLFVLTRRGESWKSRLRTVYHLSEAVYIARVIEARGIRHVHAHFEHNAASIALIVARLLDVSFSFTAHNILFTDQILLKEKVREARFIVAISEFTRRFITERTPDADRRKIHVVHCGVSPSDFVPPSPRPISGRPLVLFVGQLAERKGAPVLAEACKILAERAVPFRCVVAGDGPERAVLLQKVKRYHLEGIVELAGALPQERVRQYLNCADIFVQPCITAKNGDMDGIPVALMEAMSMQIPVVSTCVSGIPELVENGLNGILVEEKDEVALANALQQLIEDGPMRARLGQNGRLKVVEEFDVDKSASQLAALFERYLCSA